MASQHPSIKDVAKHSGTSIATVSNVLNNRRFVSEELRAKVIGAVDALGYQVNPIAQSLKNRRTNCIGVVLSDINCIFFAPMLKGIQKVLNKAGLHMIIYDSDYNADKELKYIQSIGRSYMDGMILAGIADCEDYFVKRLTAENKQIPIVSLEKDLTPYKIDSIIIDNTQSAYNATNHLIELSCKKIAIIAANPHNLSIGRERLNGYKRALAEANIPLREELICIGDFSPISGYNCMQALFRSGVSFDAVFAANDQMAVGALRAISSAGLRVPEDIKVVGFDNTFIASIVEPSLTTVSVPNYEMGVQAANQLLHRIKNPDKEARLIHMDYELIIRRSTIASARTNWDMTYW